jgi:glycosyltransferase involved in cell wall biosynthesis
VNLRSPAPLVSVLVPAFNHQEYIECGLDSIAMSSYAPLEILVIDDGSSDDTYVRACNWMKDNADRVMSVAVHQQTNQGLARTLNALVSLSRGEYVALLGSDDALEPNGIALRVSALERHPEWLAVIGDCSIIDGVGRQEVASAFFGRRFHAHLPALLNARRIARELILRWSVPGPAMLARGTAYNVGVGVGPYDEQLEVEDRDFYLRLLSVNALGFIPERVARYRLHGQNSADLRLSTVRRDGVLGNWRNIKSFSGLNRWLLTLVAIRGSARLRAVQMYGRDNHMQGRFFWLVGVILGVAQRSAYLLHRSVSPPRGS